MLMLERQKMPKLRSKDSREFFSLGEFHQKQDSNFHEPILAEGNDMAACSVSRDVMKGLGFNDEEICGLLGEPKRTSKVNKDSAFDFGDATPRPLYMHRDLVNVAEFTKWAKAQGFKDICDDLHVTIIYSKEAVDWFKMGTDDWGGSSKNNNLIITPGGPRIVEPLGTQGAIVLLFASRTLTYRHEDMVRLGASHDYDTYQPHVTITYNGAGVDLKKVKPYVGRLVFGPEIFQDIDIA